MYSPLVYPVVVLYRAEFPVLFLDKEKGGHVRRDGWSDVSLGQLFVDEVIECFVLHLVHWVDAAIEVIRRILFKVNRMVPGMQRRKVFRLLFAED